MKKFLILFFSIFICSIANADTETINWYVDGNSYATTTCQTGGDIILPNTPYKYGYTFTGWNLGNYIPIEYLESTGTQYIDTGLPILGETTVVFKINYLSTSGDLKVFGEWKDGSTATYHFVGTMNSSWYLWNYGDSNSNVHMYTNTPYTIIASWNNTSGGLIVNGNTVIYESKTGVFLNRYNAFLFAGNRTGSAISHVSAKLYNFTRYQNGIKIQDFIPVLDANGTPCMYDKVSETFFYNQGTGNFIAGPVINQ